MDIYSPAIYRGDVPQPRYARAREMKSWQDLNQVPVVHGFNQQSHHAVAVTPASRGVGTAGTSNKLTHLGKIARYSAPAGKGWNPLAVPENAPYSSLRQGGTASAWGKLSNPNETGCPSNGVGRVSVT